MKVTILKGKFKGSVVGSQVKISCNVCDKSTAGYRLDAPVPGANELSNSSANMQGRKPFAKAKAVVDRQLASPNPNAISAMIVAPVTINGRPVGCQPIVCFYCRQVGLINVEAERPGTSSFGFQPKSLNENPETHARRRVIMTFIPLLALDYLVQNKLVLPSAKIVCAGASLQCQGRKSNGSDGRPRQDAHQTLRELSIGGIPLYRLVREAPGLSRTIKNVVTYCHGVISHLDAKYNEADGLVENAIVVEMIDLGHLVLNGSLRRSAGNHDDVFARLLWRFLMVRYNYAIRMALINAGPGPLREVLLFYRSIVERMAEESPPDLVSRGLDDLCVYFEQELRQV